MYFPDLTTSWSFELIPSEPLFFFAKAWLAGAAEDILKLAICQRLNVCYLFLLTRVCESRSKRRRTGRFADVRVELILYFKVNLNYFWEFIVVHEPIFIVC